MLHRLLNLSTLLSCLFLLAIPCLWWYSRSHSSEVLYATPDGSHGILSAGRRCGYHYKNHGYDDRGWQFGNSPLKPEFTDNTWSYTEFLVDPKAFEIKFLGIHFFYLRGHGEGHVTRILIPYTHYAILSAILPALWLIRVRRRTLALRNPNLCTTCGYDLRTHLAGRAGAKCPECGTPLTVPS